MHQVTKLCKNAILEPKLHFNELGGSFCESERLTGHCPEGSIKHFWKFEVQRSKIKVARWPNMSKDVCFGAIAYPAGIFSIKSTCKGSIKGQSHHDQIWAKMQFWIHNFIQMYQVATFVNWKYLMGQCEGFLKKTEVQGSRSPRY